MLGAIACALPVIAGWLFLRAFLPALRPRWAALEFEAAAGGALGIGAGSAVYFLLVVAGAASAATVLAANALLACAAAAVSWRRGRAGAESAAPARNGFRWNWALALILAGTFALVISGLAGVSAAAPYGEWDACSIWDLRAKYLASAEWKNALSPLLERSHPDYPLLLSGFVAMIWKAEGATPQWAPCVAGFLFLALAAMLVMSALALVRATSSALLGGLVLVSSGSFLFLSTMHYADMPLSVYYGIAAAGILLARARPEIARTALCVSGAAASMAAWTKNEGLLFAVVLMACFLAVEGFTSGLRRAVADWRWMALGAAPGLILVAWFKLFLAPAAEPLFNQTAADAVQKLLDGARYAQIGKALATQAVNLGQPIFHPLLLLVILAVALRFRVPGQCRSALLACAASLVVLFAGYCTVYLLTPSDLVWHLQTSVPRLYGQIWPALLIITFVALRAPEETSRTEDARPRAPASRQDSLDNQARKRRAKA